MSKIFTGYLPLASALWVLAGCATEEWEFPSGVSSDHTPVAWSQTPGGTIMVYNVLLEHGIHSGFHGNYAMQVEVLKKDAPASIRVLHADRRTANGQGITLAELPSRHVGAVNKWGCGDTTQWP